MPRVPLIQPDSVDGELACVSRENGGVIWVTQLQRYRNEKKKKGRKIFHWLFSPIRFKEVNALLNSFDPPKW